MDVHYEFVRLPSNFKVKSDGRQAVAWSLTYLLTPSKITCDKLAGGHPGPKPWHTFDILGAETATRLLALRHDYQALLRFAALGNDNIHQVSTKSYFQTPFQHEHSLGTGNETSTNQPSWQSVKTLDLSNFVFRPHSKSSKSLLHIFTMASDCVTR